MLYMEGLKTFFVDFLRSNVGQSESRNDFSKIWSRYTFHDVLKFLRQFKKKEDLSVHVEIVTYLLKECDDEWLVGSFERKDGTDLYKRIQEVISSVYVPTFQDKEHYAFDVDDFPCVASYAEKNISFTKVLLNRLRALRNNDTRALKLICDICPSATILALEHVEERLWTTKSSIKSAESLLQCLCEIFKVEENAKLLQCHLVANDEIERIESALLYKILQLLRLKLQRETWKKSPGAKSVFVWCLNHTSFPMLSEFLESVLPPALLFTDDYMLENKVSGVSCLMHIINNVSSEELRWYGRGEVVLEALRHHLHTTEPLLLAETIPAVLSILKVVEKNPQAVENGRPVTRYDEIYQQLLQNAEGENILTMRRIYTRHLPNFVEVMGISAVRYLSNTLKVIENFLEISDGPYEEARLNVVHLLQKIIRFCWPRIPRYCDRIMKMLVKCLCDLSLDSLTISEGVKTELVAAIKETLVLLKCLDSGKVMDQLGPLDCDDVPDLCRSTCKQVVETDISTIMQ